MPRLIELVWLHPRALMSSDAHTLALDSRVPRLEQQAAARNVRLVGEPEVALLRPSDTDARELRHLWEEHPAEWRNQMILAVVTQEYEGHLRAVD